MKFSGNTARIAGLILFTIVLIIYFYFEQKTELSNTTLSNTAVLKRTTCWFTPSYNAPQTECFIVNVPENIAKPKENRLSFPLVIFRSESSDRSLPPVIHLGAGGPGAPMYLNDDFTMNYFWEAHDDFTVKSGRDLYVIDPRGTGLSSPLLTCDIFVNNLPERLGQNLRAVDEWTLADKDFRACVEHFLDQGINFQYYNSIAISDDIELLRQALSIDKWTLIGVSYGAIYAQIIAKRFPESVEALILDSPAFPNLKFDNRFLERTMAPYEALYNYCDADELCSEPLPNLRSRLWNIYEKLNASPINITLSHPHSKKDLLVVFNGERLLASLIEGTYSENIFTDLPEIILELERGEYESLRPYIEDFISFLFDTDYGDLSATAHYCFEDKPFVEFPALVGKTQEIEEQALRDTVRMSLTWPDFCDEMGINNSDTLVATAVDTSIPTLFLQGTLDSITPLVDVKTQRENYFHNSQLLTFTLSHGILGSDTDVEIQVNDFLGKVANK